MASNFESSIQRVCDFIHDFVCSPCEENGLNTEAQYFCNQCTKYFCDDCVTKHNSLYKRHVCFAADHRQYSSIQPIAQPYTSLFPQDNIFVTKDYNEYNVKMSSDSWNCDIQDICELPGGESVITDSGNNKVKLLDQGYRVVDYCDVPEYPYDVCNIGGNEVAVCVDNANDRHELHFINITKGKLVTTRKFSFSHRCYCAAHHWNNLYISSRTALYVYTMTGKFVKKLYEDKSYGNTVFRIAISIDGKIIYISDYSNNQFITMDNLGNKLATFTDPDLVGPHGVHATTAGHVFVCCYYSNAVLQVDKDGKTKLATLAGTQDRKYSPKALVFSSRTSSLVVGGWIDTLLIINLQ